GWEVWLPTAPLDELYGIRIEAWLAARNVVARLRSGVRRVVMEGAGPTALAAGVELRSGERIDADHVILAVPQNLVLALLPDECRAVPDLAAIEKLEAAPISSVHLWFDRPVTDLRHAVLVGRLGQWVFNRSAICVRHGSAQKSSPDPPWPPLAK